MRRCVIVFLLVLLWSLAPASALTDEEIFRDFRFNLINPGARSLALGGAFISLADDATAAQANPAGLSFLRKSEYFAELRVVDNVARSTVRTDSLPAGIDTFAATGTDPDDVISPSFASAVTAYGKWTLGISRHELVNLKNSNVGSFAFTFPTSPGASLTEGSGLIDVEVTNVNVSAGVRVNDRLGVGATLTYSRLAARSEVVSRILDTAGNFSGEEILEPVLNLRTTIDDTDDDVVFSLGLIYRRHDKTKNKWGVGAVFRRAPRFTMTQHVEQGIDLFDVGKRLGTGFRNRLSLPDAYGVGANWAPGERLTLTLDVERILYSNLLDGYLPGVNHLHSEDAEFTGEDGTNFRTGVEWVFVNTGRRMPPLALRGGLFSQADGAIRGRFTGNESLVVTDVFPGSGRETHGTLGVGVEFRRYKMDFAMDVSENANEYVVSFIYKGK